MQNRLPVLSTTAACAGAFVARVARASSFGALLVLAALLFVAAGCGSGGTPEASKTADDTVDLSKGLRRTADVVRATERKRLAALLGHDLDLAQKLHADDFELINPTADVVSREAYIDSGEAFAYTVWKPAQRAGGVQAPHQAGRLILVPRCRSSRRSRQLDRRASSAWPTDCSPEAHRASRSVTRCGGLQLTDVQARDSASQSQICGSCGDVAGMRAPSHGLSAAEARAARRPHRRISRKSLPWQSISAIRYARGRH